MLVILFSPDMTPYRRGQVFLFHSADKEIKVPSGYLTGHRQEGYDGAISASIGRAGVLCIVQKIVSFFSLKVSLFPQVCQRLKLSGAKYFPFCSYAAFVPLRSFSVLFHHFIKLWKKIQTTY